MERKGRPLGNETGMGCLSSQPLTLKGFVLQVRGTANSGKSGYLSTHVAGEGCKLWGQGGDPRAEASVSVSFSFDCFWTLLLHLLYFHSLDVLFMFLFHHHLASLKIEWLRRPAMYIASSVVEHMPCLSETLGLIPAPHKTIWLWLFYAFSFRTLPFFSL